MTLYLVFLSHLISDFVLQSNKLVKEKNALFYNAFIKHGVVLLLTNFVLLMYFDVINAIIFSFSITSLHLAQDFIKNKLNNSINGYRLSIFILDQLIHFVIILFIWNLIYSENGLLDLRVFELIGYHLEFLLLILIVYLTIIFIGDIIIEMSLEYINEGNQIRDNKSKYIGYIERLLVLTLVLLGEFSAIAFIFTAKSVARFQKLDEEFASYYLFGTFLSLFISIIGGQVIILLM